MPSEVSMDDVPPVRVDFASFYQKTLGPLRRYLARLTGSATDAQDLAHDAYTRVLPALRDREVGHPQAFLYTTARNLVMDRQRRQARAPFQEMSAVNEALSMSPAPAVESVVMAREEWALMEASVAELPAGCRRVLLLRTVEQLSHAEIAERLGLARSSVEKHLMRAVRLLHEAMQRKTSDQENKPLQLSKRTGSAGPLP